MIVFSNNKYRFVKPYYLQKEGEIKLIKGVVIGSTMGWFICGKFLSYRQLKYIIKN